MNISRCLSEYLKILYPGNGKGSRKTPRYGRKSVSEGAAQSVIGHGGTHYEYKPMRCTAIFHGCKNDNFQMKYCNSFNIFAQNIDCGYSLKPPQ